MERVQDSDGIAVFLEQSDGIIEDVSLEVLGKASELAVKLKTHVKAILLGHDAKQAAEEAAKRGADKVLLAENPALASYTTEAYFQVTEEVVKSTKPDVLLFGATRNGVDLASRLAAKLGVGLMAHVIDLEVEDETGLLVGSVPGYGGSIVAKCRCVKGKPQMATVKKGVFQSLQPRDVKGNVEAWEVNGRLQESRVKVLQRVVGRSVDITRAARVVIAGSGTGGDLKLPKRLAEVIDGVLGVTRPLADKGIASRDVMVGSTGYTLGSELAVIVGASGAAHFVSGIGKVGTTIAINSDPEANVFNHADYCVVGDLFQILPALIQRLESGK